MFGCQSDLNKGFGCVQKPLELFNLKSAQTFQVDQANVVGQEFGEGSDDP